MKPQTKADIKKAFRAGLPVLTGYIVLGVGFGILLRTKGYGVWWALAMSTLIYAGSMQYLAVDLLAGGASLLTAALTALTVNARHLFYGISMLDRYKGAGAKKPYLIFSLTDETYSLVCSDDANGEPQHGYYFWVSLFNQIYWVTGCVLGSLLGSVIGFNVQGIDFALTALFVTVFVEQWLTSRSHAAAVIGVVCSVACLLIFGSGNFLIPAMLAITAALTLYKACRREVQHDD